MIWPLSIFEPMRIGGADDPYMVRWRLLPRNRWGNIYVHRFLRSDEDRALHDHPWSSVSILLRGHLRETFLAEDESGAPVHLCRDIRRFWPMWRGARFAHRLETSGKGALTLFLVGPRQREWGFLCPQGWRHWRRFVDLNGPGSGPGCD